MPVGVSGDERLDESNVVFRDVTALQFESLSIHEPIIQGNEL